MFIRVFLLKDKVLVKDEKQLNVKLLKRNVFGHMVQSVHFVGKKINKKTLNINLRVIMVKSIIKIEMYFIFITI
jgi:hypothetical protein